MSTPFGEINNICYTQFVKVGTVERKSLMAKTMLDYPQRSKLVSDFMDENAAIAGFFEYNHLRSDVFKQRYEDILTKSYKREELCDYLNEFNKKYEASEEVLNNIEKLKKKETVAVVGGQQAGLLTGPILTIHKCLSIIKLAKQQEEALGVPVVPIFWIAGEDHDFHEINHVYVYDNDSVKKRAYHDFVDKKSATSLNLDHDKAKKWIETIISSFGETDYTQDLLKKLEEKLSNSDTFVDFFAWLLHDLFGKYGLILLDSGDSKLRKLESDYFQSLIEHHRSINQAVLTQMDRLVGSEYEPTIDQTPTSANLFYERHGERELLEWTEDTFQSKNKTCSFSIDELKDVARTSPELLSNNVVTRPLMQELLLPTLAFIAGPGEISYWSTLKEAFRVMSCKMPPVIPRLNITIVDRMTEKWLKESSYSVDQVILTGLEKEKEQWLKKQDQWRVDRQIEDALEEVERIHRPLRAMAADIDSNLEDISNKNLEYIKNQLYYLQKQMEKGLKKRYDLPLSKFNAIEMRLKPKDQPQERIWNVFYFMNLYGPDLIDRLMQETYDFNQKHYIFYI